MNVLLIGNRDQEERFKIKFGSQHHIVSASHPFDVEMTPDVIFWFDPQDAEFSLEDLGEYNVPVFVDSVKTTLAELIAMNGETKIQLFGFCGFNTFFERDLFEVSIHNQQDKQVLDTTLQSLSTEYELVSDRPGLVTPRVISMIINEAYYTVMEGTASKEAIDTAMKLGTNYPYGPFEWSKKIGLQHIYELLEALFLYTGDSRYRISPLLKKEYFEIVENY